MNFFVELTTNLLTVPGVACVLSEKFCQNPLDSFFGKQRAQGGRSDNPDAKQFCDSTVSLRVQSSFQSEPVRGNCGKRKVSAILSADQPLQKRRRNKKIECGNISLLYNNSSNLTLYYCPWTSFLVLFLVPFVLYILKSLCGAQSNVQQLHIHG